MVGALADGCHRLPCSKEGGPRCGRPPSCPSVGRTGRRGSGAPGSGRCLRLALVRRGTRNVSTKYRCHWLCHLEMSLSGGTTLKTAPFGVPSGREPARFLEQLSRL